MVMTNLLFSAQGDPAARPLQDLEKMLKSHSLPESISHCVQSHDGEQDRQSQIRVLCRKPPRQKKVKASLSLPALPANSACGLLAGLPLETRSVCPLVTGGHHSPPPRRRCRSFPDHHQTEAVPLPLPHPHPVSVDVEPRPIELPREEKKGP